MENLDSYMYLSYATPWKIVFFRSSTRRSIQYDIAKHIQCVLGDLNVLQYCAHVYARMCDGCVTVAYKPGERVSWKCERHMLYVYMYRPVHAFICKNDPFMNALN